MKLITKAWDFAAEKHKEQKVPNSDFPYILHLARVVSIVGQHNLTVKEKKLATIAAILHDTLEDTNTSEDEIINIFGSEIFNAVKALTKNNTLPKEEQMLDSLNRIKQQPKWVWCVKLSDRISNMICPPENWSVQKREKYKEEALLIARELLSKETEFLYNMLIDVINDYPLTRKPKF